MKRITVQYYAVFREQKGLQEEVIATDAPTAGDLYRELGFGLRPELVRASINLEFKPLHTAIVDGDIVVFIPPVAGG